MENEIGKRIEKIQQKLGLNQGEFSKEINISQTTVSRVESGERKPSKALLNAMKMRYSINPEWIMSGKGPMFLTAEDYISKGIELFGERKMSEGLAKILENPQFAKFHALVKAGNLVGESEIDDELAAYLRYILKNWDESERKRHWVMGQLEMVFRDVK